VPQRSGHSAPPLASLGLGGDGDEINAIRDVERAFGVVLDYDDAPTWIAAGEVFESVRRALPPSARDDAGLWPRFAEAIARETGVDPARVAPGTVLLAPASRRWIALAAVAAVGAVVAVLTR
jgi:hypothetical protein